MCFSVLGRCLHTHPPGRGWRREGRLGRRACSFQVDPQTVPKPQFSPDTQPSWRHPAHPSSPMDFFIAQEVLFCFPLRGSEVAPCDVASVTLLSPPLSCQTRVCATPEKLGNAAECRGSMGEMRSALSHPSRAESQRGAQPRYPLMPIIFVS